MNQKEFDRRMALLAESQGLEVTPRTKEKKANLTKNEMVRSILNLYKKDMFDQGITIGLIQKVALDSTKDWEEIY